MKGLFKRIREDSVAWFSFWSCLIIYAISLIAIGVLYKQLPPYLPLYNHMPWGYGRIGSKIELFIPLLIALSLSGLNIWLALKIKNESLLLARFLHAINFSLAIFVLIFLIRIAQVIL